MKFNYQARTKEGKIQTGVIEASNRQAAVVVLQKYDVFVTSLTEEVEKGVFLKKLSIQKKISRKDLVVFSRQLAVMLDSRVPVMQSLSSLALQSTKPNFKKIISQIANLIEEGIPLSEAFGRFPKVFDNFFVSLVKSGEVSGKISQTLYYISDHLEKEEEIAGQVRQAMIYPAFTISVLFIVVNIVILFLLPKVQELIKESTNEPTFFTTLTLGFYDFLGHWWWIMMLGLCIGVGALFFYFRTENGKKIFDRLLLKTPLIKDILRKIFLTRFCGNVSTLIVAGISINKALQITADTVDSEVYRTIIGDIEKKVSEGEKISAVLGGYEEYFPAFVVQMIKVGEETGKLDKTLLEVVTFYEKEIKKSIDLFLTLLEPMLIIVLGAVVGLLAISVFAPLYSTLGTI